MNSENRKVSFKLGVGIFFLPLVFAWWTLGNGYSKTARIVSFVWMGIMLIAVVGGRGHGGNGGTTTAPPTTVQEVAPTKVTSGADSRQDATSAAPEKAAPEVGEKKQPEVEMGERFQLGNFAYTVDKLEAKTVIGNRFVNKKSTEGAVFLIVNYTIENLGQETETVMSDDFKIVDGQSRTFRPSSEANTTLSMTSDSKDMFLSEIQPGIKRPMSTAFEIPSLPLGKA